MCIGARGDTRWMRFTVQHPIYTSPTVLPVLMILVHYRLFDIFKIWGLTGHQDTPYDRHHRPNPLNIRL